MRFKLQKDFGSIFNKDVMIITAQQVKMQRQVLGHLIDIVLFIGMS